MAGRYVEEEKGQVPLPASFLVRGCQMYTTKEPFFAKRIFDYINLTKEN
jgi:hypothetical protein